MIDTAIILVGGLGTRLKPLTDEIPKPLLPIKGKPIVQHTIENLKKYGIRNIILAVSYKSEQIQAYFKDGKEWEVNISYSIEDNPLGTGGAIKQAAKNLNEPFFLVWGDNLMDIDYNMMYKDYLRDAPQVTMALTPREDVENFGVAQLQENKIISFVEKPNKEEAPSNLINAGAFIIDPECLIILPEGKSSIERDCFEKLAPLGEISAHIHQGQWFPTDNLEKYNQALEKFRPIINLKEKKIIIADVDETICESCQEISIEMAQVIDEMSKRGYQFAFISGTKPESLHRMISSKLKEQHHILGNTGTKYVHVKDNKCIEQYDHQLNEEEKKEVIAALKTLTIKYDLKPMTTVEDQIQDRGSQITLSAIGRHAPKESKANFDPDGNKRKTWIKFLYQELGENKYDINIGGTTSIDITHKGWDKEKGIKKFAEHNNIKLSEAIFFGDKIYPGGNDYPATKILDCIPVTSPEDTFKKLKQMFP